MTEMFYILNELKYTINVPGVMNKKSGLRRVWIVERVRQPESRN